ncbi:hypothetical protein EWB00_011324 [Schistosoma japonicum]|uniref:Uncharacterized protein n=1 Tax=Schistosoma japonicum TaxID=6182 RepID=A0A4Z2DL35_SCHJA|nr:hypothetical protein EWB00_011324 [Schistosoma japonicum]
MWSCGARVKLSQEGPNIQGFITDELYTNEDRTTILLSYLTWQLSINCCLNLSKFIRKYYVLTASTKGTYETEVDN